MGLDVSPDLEARIMAKAQAEGASVTAYLERLLEEREELRSALLSNLRERLDESLRDAERGELADGEEFTASLIGKLDARARRLDVPFLELLYIAEALGFRAHAPS